MKLKIYPLLILITCYLFACTSNKTEEISPEIKKVLQEAYQLYLQEKYVQAESLLVANDCLNIPSADAMELMAKIRVAQIKHDEAVDFYRRTIKYEPDRKSAWLGLINSLQELGQLEEAAKTLQKARKKFSNDPQLLYQGGQLAIKQGQFKQAAGLLEKAIHQDSTLVQAYYALANAYFRLGKKEAGDKMMKHYRELSEKIKDLELDYRIARLNPGSAEAHYNLARAYERVRDYPHAIAEYKRTIDLNPNFPEAYNNLGILFFRFNKYQEAEILFKQAVSLSDTTAKYHFNLGAVYARTGKLDQARYHWQQALRLDPGYEKARRFLQRLEKN
ncbi:MAG: tetratricopeptide repeat protein [Calditrichaeota bacterium]|nr:MAG: tetratricopeptide repeat protein [Calditrichota bacterium]